jgi:hypothetical protein
MKMLIALAACLLPLVTYAGQASAERAFMRKDRCWVCQIPCRPNTICGFKGCPTGLRVYNAPCTCVHVVRNRAMRS